MYLNITKTIYYKTIANIILHGKNLKATPLRLAIRKICTHSPFLFNTVFEVLAIETRQKKK